MVSRELPSDQRGIIKDSLRKAIMLWDDVRASQDVGPMLGSPFTIIQSTPKSLEEAHLSSEKTIVMSAIVDAVSTLGCTNGFRRYLLETVFSPQFDFGMTADMVFPQLRIDLNKDNLGDFEPDKLADTEAGYLDGDLRAVCNQLVGTFFYAFTEDMLKNFTTAQITAATTNLFFNPNENRFITKDELREGFNQHIPGYFESIGPVLFFRLLRLKECVEWAGEVADKYNNHSLDEAIENARPLLEYL